MTWVGSGCSGVSVLPAWASLPSCWLGLPHAHARCWGAGLQGGKAEEGALWQCGRRGWDGRGELPMEGAAAVGKPQHRTVQISPPASALCFLVD